MERRKKNNRKKEENKKEKGWIDRRKNMGGKKTKEKDILYY